MAGCIEYRVELHVDFVIMSGDVLGLCRQNNTYKHVHSMELLHKKHNSYETDHRPFRPSIAPSVPMSLRIIPLFRPDREIGRWIGTTADLARSKARHQKKRILMKTPSATGKSGGSSAGRPMKSGLAMLVPGSLVPPRAIISSY